MLKQIVGPKPVREPGIVRISEFKLFNGFYPKSVNNDLHKRTVANLHLSTFPQRVWTPDIAFSCNITGEEAGGCLDWSELFLIHLGIVEQEKYQHAAADFAY